MPKETLYRAASELVPEGRTLLGIAMPWDTPTLVRDPGRPPYMEAFTRTSFDRSLAQRPEPRPLYWSHEYRVRADAEPFGVVDFKPAAEGLIFRAYVSRTRMGDEKLELVRDGAIGDASVGVFPVQPGPLVRARQNETLVRTEVGLLELSLASVGFGQYPGAKVLAVRAASDSMSFGAIGEAVSDALEASLFPATGDEQAGCYVCIVDMSDEWAVYSIGGNVTEEAEGLWRCEYTMAADGTVTLGAAVRVEMSYTPVTGPEAAAAARPDDAVAARALIESDPLAALRQARVRGGWQKRP